MVPAASPPRLPRIRLIDIRRLRLRNYRHSGGVLAHLVRRRTPRVRPVSRMSRMSRVRAAGVWLGLHAVVPGPARRVLALDRRRAHVAAGPEDPYEEQDADDGSDDDAGYGAAAQRLRAVLVVVAAAGCLCLYYRHGRYWPCCRLLSPQDGLGDESLGRLEHVALGVMAGR